MYIHTYVHYIISCKDDNSVNSPMRNLAKNLQVEVELLCSANTDDISSTDNLHLYILAGYILYCDISDFYFNSVRMPKSFLFLF
jgi:hypothetical protein